MKVSAQSRLQYKINSAIMLLLLFIVAALLGWLSLRYQSTIDLTANGRHSLSNASIETLKQLDGPLAITSYASETPELRDIIRAQVKRYQQHKADIELTFVNQVAMPEKTAELGITVDGEMILEYQGRSQHVKSDSEEEFTNALSRLLRTQDHWLGFVTGHGERDALGQANHDLSIWVNALEQRGFKAQPINLTELNAIPDNTRVLVIAYPRVNLLTGELAMIQQYIERGGNVLWLAEPGKMNGLESLAETLNLRLVPGIIIDYVGQLLGSNDPTIAIASNVNYSAHASLEEFDLTTLFPTVAAIETLDQENSTWNTTTLINSGEHTWAETGAINNATQFDQGVDTIGPHQLAVALQRSLELNQEDSTDTSEQMIEQRIVVMGDGDFLSNQFVANGANMELGLRLINWLAADDELISIPMKTADDLYLELSQTTKVIIILGFWIVLPLLLLITGLTIWWRRKRQ